MKYPFSPFKVDGTFGERRSSTYIHEGLDINGLGGGNTDCGTPLYPLTDCEIIVAKVYQYYGNVIVYKIEGKWGTRYVRYAHCKSFLKQAGFAGSDEPIAEMGTTGNSTACHLHFDIFKKMPPNNNWGWWPRTTTQLNEYFEDTANFIKRWEFDESNMAIAEWLRTMFLELGIDLVRPEGEIRGRVQSVIDGYKKYEDLQKQVTNLQKELEGSNAEIGGLEKRLQTIEKNRADYEAEVGELRREITARDKQIEALDKRLNLFEGKIVLTEDEYDRLKNKKVIDRYTKIELFIEILKRFIPRRE